MDDYKTTDDALKEMAAEIQRLRDDNTRLTAELSAAEMAFRASEQAHLEAWNKALDEAAAALRAECGSCGGSGYDPRSTNENDAFECECCGRPMAYVLALKNNHAQNVEKERAKNERVDL